MCKQHTGQVSMLESPEMFGSLPLDSNNDRIKQSQFVPWQTVDVEFGAKDEMSVVDGFLRIEDLRWDAYNECTTFQESVEAYKRSYGHYPQRVLADTFFRTREDMKCYKEHRIHLNAPKIGKPYSDPAIQRQQKKLE